MIDFDKDFEKFMFSWYKEHEDDYVDIEAAEADVPDVYQQWCDKKQEKLGGVSPIEYFEQIVDPSVLIGYLVGSDSPSSLLLDRIVRVKECAAPLMDIVKSDSEVGMKICALNLLNEIDVDVDTKILVDVMCNISTESEVRDVIIEILSVYANDVAEQLYNELKTADNELTKCIAEVLIYAKKDDRTLSLLLELFAVGDDIPLYASYLGKYGDERACDALYKKMVDCNYLEYMEIKNAIESMGGVVDDVRDFTDDKYYKLLKGVESK